MKEFIFKCRDEIKQDDTKSIIVVEAEDMAEAFEILKQNGHNPADFYPLDEEEKTEK